MRANHTLDQAMGPASQVCVSLGHHLLDILNNNPFAVDLEILRRTGRIPDLRICCDLCPLCSSNPFPLAIQNELPT